MNDDRPDYRAMYPRGGGTRTKTKINSPKKPVERSTRYLHPRRRSEAVTEDEDELEELFRIEMGHRIDEGGDDHEGYERTFDWWLAKRQKR